MIDLFLELAKVILIQVFWNTFSSVSTSTQKRKKTQLNKTFFCSS